MITDYQKRWSLEVTLEESRAHLGVETQRQWSDKAIARSTPGLLGLYSLVMVCGQALHPEGEIPVAQAAWYPKVRATFSAVLATVRYHWWGAENICTDGPAPDQVLMARAVLSRLLHAVCY